MYSSIVYSNREPSNYFEEAELKRFRRNQLPVLIAERGWSEIPPALLQCRLFSIAHLTAKDLLENDAGLRMHVNARIETGFSNVQQYLEYDGVLLTQDHLKVLLGLITLAARKEPSEWIEFYPRAFARDVLGLGENSYTVKKIKRALRDMRGAQITRRWGDDYEASTLTLIEQLSVDDQRKVIRVKFHSSILHLFRGFNTYLPVKELRELNAGLETWLWAFVRSTDGKTAFDTEWLYRMSGASSCMSLVEFSRDLGRALARLQELEVIKDYTRSRGKVAFKK